MSILVNPNPLNFDQELHAEARGRRAGRIGLKFTANPYPYASTLWDAWNEGFFATTSRRRPLKGHQKPPLLEDEFERDDDLGEGADSGDCIVCGEPIPCDEVLALDYGTCRICSRCAD